MSIPFSGEDKERHAVLQRRQPPLHLKTYLPVAVFPTLIALPEKCKCKDRTNRPVIGREICEPQIQFVLMSGIQFLGMHPIVHRPDDSRLRSNDDSQDFSARHTPQ